MTTSSRAPASPPVDRVIQSFNEELDQLTKSLDEVLTQRYRTSPPTSAKENEHNHNSSHNYANHTRSSYDSSFMKDQPPPLKHVLKDPPPSSQQSLDEHGVSPLRSHGVSAAAPPSSSRRRRTTTPAFSDQKPPAPVQTPAYLFPTPNQQRHTPLEEEEEVVDRRRPRYYNSSSKQRPQQKYQDDYKMSSSPWKDALEQMRHTLSEQDERIRQLERDNARLRAELAASNHNNHRQPQEPPRVRRSYEPQSSHDRTAGAMFTSPPPPSSSTTNRNHHNHNDTTVFSPGTQFVAELATLMKLEPGHSAPLSVLLDKHWDQLKWQRHLEHQR